MCGLKLVWDISLGAFELRYLLLRIIHYTVRPPVTLIFPNLFEFLC